LRRAGRCASMRCMSTPILVVVGSLRRESINRKLARAIESLAPPDFAFTHADVGALPLYDQDDDDSPAEPVVRLKEQIRASRGLLFVTPEYNRSMPGVLKNALDHASRPYGQNAWAGKPAGVIGASPGAAGTAMAQQHLRNVLAYLDVPVLGQPEAFLQVKEETFGPSGELADERTRKFVQKWVDAYVAWVKRLSAS
jgi:chromate reductase